MSHQILSPDDNLPLSDSYSNESPSERVGSCDSTDTDSPTSYKDLAVVKKISKGKLPIYLTASKANQQSYAMKVFHYEGVNLHSYYQNEVRFASLKHPNIISMVHFENEQTTKHWGQVKKVSYILMEYTPYGDFLKFVNEHSAQIDEKLARTYFRQLIDGIEYLHEHGGAHLDIKPENLLIGADFSLKITDFDMSYMVGDDKILSRGTRFYRGPEFFRSTSSHFPELLELKDPFAADIYSAGILLFILKCGTYPHSEDRLTEGICLVDLMYQNNEEFWDVHCELQDRDSKFFGSDFKELFNGMVKSDPKERLTIKQIKASKWYNGPVYSPCELNEKMEEILDVKNSDTEKCSTKFGF